MDSSYWTGMMGPQRQGWRASTYERDFELWTRDRSTTVTCPSSVPFASATRMISGDSRTENWFLSDCVADVSDSHRSCLWGCFCSLFLSSRPPGQVISTIIYSKSAYQFSYTRISTKDMRVRAVDHLTPINICIIIGEWVPALLGLKTRVVHCPRPS